MHLFLVTLRIQPLVGHVRKGQPRRVDRVEGESCLFRVYPRAFRLSFVLPLPQRQHPVLVRIRYFALAIGALIVGRR